MTARELLTYALIEVNKLEAPSLLLEDYIYILNKAVQQYINKVYNRFDINQQSTDDLRVLQTDIMISDITSVSTDIVKRSSIILPADYLHILNCIVNFVSSRPISSRCTDSTNKTLTVGCKKMTMDIFPQAIMNHYMRPSVNNPYFLINNNNISSTVPTNQTMDSQISPNLQDGEFREEKEALDRTSNQSNVYLEILFGKDDNYDVDSIYISYIKSPMYITLTEEQIEDPRGDSSQIIEFPDYVCYEIINEFTKLVLENASDPRLQTHLPVNQTIMTGNQQ